MRFTILVAVVVLATGLISGASAQQISPSTSSGGSLTTNAYGSSEFRLGPDDVIEVSVYQDKDFTTTVPVRPDGKVSLHFVGEIAASGKTTKELQKEIAERLTQYTNPAVTVTVKEVNSPKISIFGEVRNPNVYKIKDRATIMDAVAMAGGMTEYAKKDKINVYRLDANGNQRLIKLKWDDQVKSGKNRRSEPFYVLPYDKIYIE